jgi:CspA family cold shock protein
LSKRRKGLAIQANSRCRGTVKWFNTTKGFGFIQPAGGGGDVFVHISAVEASGLSALAEGQEVSYELAEGRDGRSAAEKIEVSAAEKRTQLTVVGQAPAHKGVLKWFNPDKRFGFIAPADGGKDAFLHIKEIERSGLDSAVFASAKDDTLRLMYDQEPARDGRMRAVNIAII